MKIEKGMYVRTLTEGIVKVLYEDGTGFKAHNGTYYMFDSPCIIKASYNIIDLIEVGDYVNGEKVVHNTLENKGNIVIVQSCFCYINNEIKSIVTKEQFEQISYKVGEDNDNN